VPAPTPPRRRSGHEPPAPGPGPGPGPEPEPGPDGLLPGPGSDGLLPDRPRSGPPSLAVLSLDDLAGQVLAEWPRLGRTHLVVVDGPAGSGKSTLAGRLLAAFARHPDRPSTVLVHLDDLYEGWSGMRADRGAGTVSERLTGDLLDPLRRGEPGGWRRYDWAAGAFAEWHAVAVPDVLLLEGCGSADPAFDGWTSRRVWVEAPRTVRTRRGLDRDGPQMTAHWREWQDEEDALFGARATRDRCELRVDGDPRAIHGLDHEIVLLA